MSDLDLAYFCIFGHISGNCWAKPFQIFTQGSLGYGHSSDVIKSLAVCTTAIYGYIMFSVISQKCVFGHNF